MLGELLQVLFNPLAAYSPIQLGGNEWLAFDEEGQKKEKRVALN
jgi:hypothetical protein